MENTIKEVRCFDYYKVGKKYRDRICKIVEVGKWYKFDVLVIGEDLTGYGKVVKIEDGKVYAEKYFELPSYRPYATTKWFDNLPQAILEK